MPWCYYRPQRMSVPQWWWPDDDRTGTYARTFISIIILFLLIINLFLFLPATLSPSMLLIIFSSFFPFLILPLCLYHILLWNAFPSFSTSPLHFPLSPFHIMVLQDLVTIGDDASIDDASLIAHINTRGIYRLNPLSVGKGCVLKSGTLQYSTVQYTATYLRIT